MWLVGYRPRASPSGISNLRACGAGAVTIPPRREVDATLQTSLRHGTGWSVVDTSLQDSVRPAEDTHGRPAPAAHISPPDLMRRLHEAHGSHGQRQHESPFGRRLICSFASSTCPARRRRRGNAAVRAADWRSLVGHDDCDGADGGTDRAGDAHGVRSRSDTKRRRADRWRTGSPTICTKVPSSRTPTSL